MNYQCVTDLHDVKEYLSGAGIVAFDFETAPLLQYRDDPKASLDAHRACIVGISLSHTPGSAIYIPLHHLDGDNADKDVIVPYLKEALFTNHGVIKVAHNLAFESMFLYALGIILQPPCYDTIAAAQLTLKTRFEFRNLSDSGLKKLVPELLGIELPSFEDVTQGRFSDELPSHAHETVHYACADSDYSQPTRKLFDVMTQGSGDARKQPLFFFLTTAGTDRNSICWEVHQKAVDILEGRKRDPRFYPVVFGLPETEDWKSEKNWHKANPSLGHTIGMDKVRDAYHKAIESPADENMFRQLRLNQWVKQSVRWMPMDKWDECGAAFDISMLDGRACYAGLDLASTSDLTTIVLVFPPDTEDEPYFVLPFFWLPDETLELRVRRDHVMYDVWEKQEFIQTTEGNVVHYGFIEQRIIHLGEKYNIREIAYDRWNAAMMVQALEDDGFTMVPFGQGFRDMSPPTKELMRLVLEHRIAHGGHPVLRWNMDNAFVKTDPAGNLKIDKAKSTEKVDGAVALVMALDRAMKNQGGHGSVYDDDRGLLLI